MSRPKFQLSWTAIFAIAIASFFSNSTFAQESDPFGENYPQFNGKIISEIQVIGLKRSRDRKVRWMLGGAEGESFDAKRWKNGIEHLYHTSSVYEIHTDIKPVNVGGIDEIAITVHLTDKWTLFPYAELQGGGGSLNIEAGVFDTNVAGTFAAVSVSGAYLDGSYSYDVNFLQNWVLGSDYAFGLDIARIDTPVIWQNEGSTTLKDFIWSRQQQQIFIGKHNGENIHLGAFLDLYKDSVKRTNNTGNDIVYGLEQYRIRPSIKVGKTSASEYLEQGHELTFSSGFANPLHPPYEYQSATVSWKDVYYFPDTKNVAYFLSVGTMSRAPLAYQFRLGGFDTVRGFATNRAIGRTFARGSFEYRATLWRHQFPFLDLDRVILQGCAFSDVGEMWKLAGQNLAGSHTQNGSLALGSVGIGIRAILLKFSDAILRIDAARAVFPKEGMNISFGVGQFF
jgi:outer membrane protein assembly factor BamA